MAENDIYDSKGKYERAVANLDNVTKPPKKTNLRNRYYCKNVKNKKYFEKLIHHFEAQDFSYIRRYKLLSALKIITFATEKELATCEREDVDAILAFGHKIRKTVASKEDFIKDLKCIWRLFFPERDHQGRVDERLVPYAVRHICGRVDKSKQTRRNDKITWEEYQRILRYFEKLPHIQAYIALAVESLGRPQEILYTKIRDYEFYDNYAKIWISSHGKEGTGFLQCIDSYPFVMKWFQQHPFKDDPDSYFFINTGNRGLYKQMNPKNLNARLKHALQALRIDKNVTCYSLKRNGVTFCRQRGESDVEIQHKARWNSTRQLQTYDMTTQEDALTSQLKKRGFVDPNKNSAIAEPKACGFCSHVNGFTADFCVNCKRPLDRQKIVQMQQLTEQLASNELVHRFAKLEQMFEEVIGGAK